MSVVGTIALILVAGGIFTHNIAFLHHFMDTIPTFIKDFVVGAIAGLLVVVIIKILKKIIALVRN